MTAANYRPPVEAGHSRTAIAHHESAHAIIALVFKRSVESLDIYEGSPGSWGGHVVVGPPDPNGSFIESCLSTLLFLFAGPVAMRRAAPRSTFDWSRSFDLDNAREIVAMISASEQERPALLRWARQEAEYYVERNWLTIRTLASVLMERTYLAGPEVSEIARQVDAISAEERAKVRDTVTLDPETKRLTQVSWHRRRPISRRMIADA